MQIHRLPLVKDFSSRHALSFPMLVRNDIGDRHKKSGQLARPLFEKLNYT
jgi:hypothetical protein